MQRCKFLGVIIDSKKFVLENTEDRKKKTLALLKQMIAKENFIIEDLASLIGKFETLISATTYGRVYGKRLERQKFLAFKVTDQDYS